MVQTERGDGVLNHYVLENSWQAISDPSYCGTLLSPPFYFPAKYTIFYSENLFGTAPLYWVLRLFLSCELAYSWWQILLNLLNFLAFAIVARWLKWPHVLALGGAFMWAFAMVHADQVKHQQLICRCWMPMAAYYAISFLTVPSAKALSRLFGCIFLQCLACIYTGWFLVVGLAVFIPVMAVMLRGTFTSLKQFARANRTPLLRVIGLWGLAMALLFVPYLMVNWGIGRKYDECHYLMPTPSAWLTGPPDSKWIVSTWPYRVPVYLECWLFSGFTLYLLMFGAAASLFVWRRGTELATDGTPRFNVERAIIAGSMVTVLVWILLTITPKDTGDSAWRFVRYMPGGLAIRCVSRVYLIVYLFGILAGLTWLDQITRRIRREWLRSAILAIAIGLMIFEQTEYQQQAFERRCFYPLVDETAARLKGAKAGWIVPRYVDPHGKVMVGPYGEVFGMWVGLRANVPVLNGYSGRAPTGFPPMGAISDDQIRDWLRGKFRGTVRVIDTEIPEKTRDVIVE